jgi:hypothetical protein
VEQSGGITYPDRRDLSMAWFGQSMDNKYEGTNAAFVEEN